MVRTLVVFGIACLLLGAGRRQSEAQVPPAAPAGQSGNAAPRLPATGAGTSAHRDTIAPRLAGLALIVVAALVCWAPARARRAQGRC